MPRRKGNGGAKAKVVWVGKCALVWARGPNARGGGTGGIHLLLSFEDVGIIGLPLGVLG